MLSFDVNWLALFVAGVAAMAVGMIWYSDALFGKQWRSHMGISEAEAKAMKEAGMAAMWPNMLGGFVSYVVMGFFLVNFMAWAGVSGVGGALEFTFWLWLGFFAMQMLGSVFWEKRAFSFYLINAFYVLAMLLAVAAVVSAWV